MNRRSLLMMLTGVSVTTAGCAQSSDPSSDPTTESESPIESMTSTETESEQPTTDARTTVQVDPGGVVALYDFAYDLHGNASQQFDDALSAYEGESYVQSIKQFAYAQQQFADSNGALVRVTRTLTETSGGGFQYADAAQTRTNLLERAAQNYAGASIEMVEGNESAAESLAENAASFRNRASNYSFATPATFESDYRDSQ